MTCELSEWTLYNMTNFLIKRIILKNVNSIKVKEINFPIYIKKIIEKNKCLSHSFSLFYYFFLKYYLYFHVTHNYYH